MLRPPPPPAARVTAPARTSHSGFAGADRENGRMRVILNIIWLVLSGFWMFLAYMLAGVILCIPIITIPWAIASFRIGVYALWPFGKTIVDKPTAGVGSFIGNVIWVILAGIWLAIGHILTGVAMCITIIGIPLGIASFKLVPISLMPLGKDIVDVGGSRAFPAR